MRKCFVVIAIMSCLTVAVQAKTIAINLAADEADGARSDVFGAAGVLGTPNWNNLDGNAGAAANLIDDSGAVTSTSVEWVSANTWSSTGRSEENNTAPAGNDRNMMTGYLDTSATSTTTVAVSGLGGDFAAGYDVYLYIKGGTNDGRGGSYTIGTETQIHTPTSPFDGTYTVGTEGDYLLFEGLMGDSFTIEATPTTEALFRAPLNGIEINAIPEPATLILLGLGSLATLRRKRK